MQLSLALPETVHVGLKTVTLGGPGRVVSAGRHQSNPGRARVGLG